MAFAAPAVRETAAQGPAHVPAYARTMQLHASARPRDDYTAEPHRFTVEADTYDAALAQAQASVPEGWILQHVQVDR